jgi:glycosyltransferase involved in cell wall biosynthesis
MFKDRDFVIFGLQSWDVEIGSTCKYTALEISKNNRVLFVSIPLQRGAWLKERHKPEVKKRLSVLKGLVPNLEKVGDNIWNLYPKTVFESINWINNPRIFDFFNKLNERRLAKEIKKAIEQLGFKDIIILNDNSMLVGYYLKELLKPQFYIYLLRDAVTLVPYHAKHGTRLEPLLISKIDLVVTNSDYFKNFAARYNSQSYMIGQGCDLTMYSDPDGTMPVPEGTIPIKRPVIGYTGVLTTIRLDINILVYIAEQKPEWTLLLVGPEDEDFRKSKLHQFPNVIFTGRKEPRQLPAYIKSFDVAINPQMVNPITDINYPLKIDEYLAMGKPTVATKTTFMAYFSEYSYLPSSPEEYIIAIEKALSENTPELEKRRKQFAAGHSWENFVNKIYIHAYNCMIQKGIFK